MRYSNFEYNGIMLSDFNCVVGNFDGSESFTTNSDGNRLSFNTATFANVDKFRLLNPTYEQPYKHTFSIVKNNCNVMSDQIFSQDETNAILRWLNRKEYHIFNPLDSDNMYTGFFYNATFNVGEITLNGDVVGFTLELIADAPFGYYGPFIYEGIIGTNNSLLVDDPSSEMKQIYPTVKLTVGAGGTVVLTNSASDKETIIKNCIEGETLTFYGDTKIIESDKEHKKLYNDFNYIFPIIKNSVTENGDDIRENYFTANQECNIIISYSPICKMGLG